MTRTARARLVAAALATGLLLPGCTAEGIDDIGVAASVGEDSLSVNELQEQVRLVQESGVTPAVESGEIINAALTFFVVGELVERLAQARGVTVTDGEAAQALQAVRAADQLQELIGGAAANGVPARDLERFVEVNLLIQALQEQGPVAEGDLAAVAEEAGVDVSPRYGTFDVEQATVVPQIGGGLSREAEPADGGRELLGG